MHILWCLLLGVLLAEVSVDAQCSKYSNGCSVWNIVPYKKEFTPACYRHDVCYGCGAKFGTSRLSCDKAFLSDMKKICRDNRLPNNCLVTADLYYKGVRIGGERYYKKTPERYCLEWWVRSCLP